MIDLNDVALFVQVARSRSFAAAARQLGRPANTLSLSPRLDGGVPRGPSPDGGVEEAAVTGRFSGNTAQTLRKAAIAGLGIALLPASITRPDVRADLLRPVLPSWRP